MKTLHILVIVLALTFSPCVAKAHEYSRADSIAARIQSTIQLPESCNNEENQRVFVVFSIAQNGSVMVHEVGTQNANLKSSLTSQFESMKFDNAKSDYDGMYSIWLNFKIL